MADYLLCVLSAQQHDRAVIAFSQSSRLMVLAFKAARAGLFQAFVTLLYRARTGCIGTSFLDWLMVAGADLRLAAKSVGHVALHAAFLRRQIEYAVALRT